MTTNDIENHYLAGFITDDAHCIESAAGPYFRGAIIGLDVDAFDGSSCMTSRLSPEQYYLEFASRPTIKGTIAIRYFYGPANGDGAAQTLLDVRQLYQVQGLHKITEISTFERNASEVRELVNQVMTNALSWTLNGNPELWSYGTNYVNPVIDVGSLALAFRISGREFLSIAGSKQGEYYFLRKPIPSVTDTNVSVGFIAGLTPAVKIHQDTLARFTRNQNYRATPETNHREAMEVIERSLRRNQRNTQLGAFNSDKVKEPTRKSVFNSDVMPDYAAQYTSSTYNWLKLGKEILIPPPDIAKPAVPYDPTAPRKRPL